MKAVLFLFLLCLYLVSLDARQFRCDYLYDKPSKGWYKLQTVPANWHEAKLRCQLEGGTLASPSTPVYASAMMTLMDYYEKPAREVFTGIHAAFSRGDYYSIEGVPMWQMQQPWAANEPNNINDKENCISMLSNGDLADVSCDNPLPYICFKKRTSIMAVSNCGTTDPAYNFDSRTGSCYKFHRVPRTWSRAYMACSAEGGYLAIINSDAEAQVLIELFAKNPASAMLGTFGKDIAFIGFHDWNEHGEWLTVHGQTLQEAGYSKFSSGEPNNGTGEFCGAIYRNALINDAMCETKYAFICEKNPDSLVECPSKIIDRTNDIDFRFDDTF